MGYGQNDDYDVSKATDQFLINLQQDWLLSKQLFGTSERTDKMLKAIKEEMKCRNLKTVDYGWVDCRTFETECARSKVSVSVQG